MHFIAKGESTKIRKNVLLVDNNCEFENLLRGPLTETFAESTISLNIVRAKDGPDAAAKSENQKFDVVLIDTEVPRMMDGGFIYSLPVNRNIKQASVIVVSHKNLEELPDTLRNSKIFRKPVAPKEIIEFMVQTINKGAPVATSPAKNAVDVRMINSVIQSTLKVWKEYGIDSLTMQKAESCSCDLPLRGEVSSIIEIKSTTFKGFLALTFEKNSFLEIVGKMLGEDQPELDEKNWDAAGELNNIILGNAKSELNHYGFQMTTPKIFKGTDTRLSCPEGSAAMMIPFKSSRGQFFIVVAALPKS